MKKHILIFIFSLLCISFSSAAEAPILKVGLFSDTHVRKNIASCNSVKAAWQVFKKENCDLVVNLGDIAHVPDTQAYRHYRNTVNALFAPGEKRPRELYIYANHDRIGFEDVDKAFAALKKDLEIPNDPYDKLVLKGYPFLVFPQFLDLERYEKTIAETIKKFPGKPVFVLDHIPPFRTISHSKTWGSFARRDAMVKFPQAIHISGHVHGSTFNECHIWQGEFTAVNAGSSMSGTVLILEIYKERLLFRRFSLVDGKEHCTDRQWSIPWPFDPATAPFRPEYRKERSETPAFPAGAKLAVSRDEKMPGYIVLEIPAASPEVHYYMLTIEKKNTKGKWDLVTKHKINSDFRLRPMDRPSLMKRYISEGYFDSNAEFRILAEPVNFYGKQGKGIQLFWKASLKCKSKVIFESKDPMNELPFLTELAGGVPLKKENGFYINDVHHARLVFPDRVWASIPKNARVRFTVDMHTIQKNDLFRQWTIVLRHPTPLSNACHRIYTLSDESIRRFVINFNMVNTDHRYYLLLREGEPGKVRFNYVKIEILEENSSGTK